MITNLKLLVSKLLRLSSRARARLARRWAEIGRGAARLMAAGLPASLGRVLAQMAVAAAMFAGVAAVATPALADFPVSEAETFNQGVSDIACDADGDYVVVWQSTGQDGSSNGIYARRFNASHIPVSNEFRVNQQTTSVQQSPAVAMDAHGDFVVVWESYVGGYPYYNEIMGRRYDAHGVPLGDEFQVNTPGQTSGDEYNPDVAVDASGDFVVVWDAFSVDANSRGVAARLYASDGTPQGAEFLVNDTETGNQGNPSVAMDATGNFVVVWDGPGIVSSSLDGVGVFGRRFDAAGVAQGTEFALHNTNVANPQYDAAIAMDVDGNFVTCFTTYLSSVSTQWVYRRRFDATATPLDANEVRVNSSSNTHVYHSGAAVASDADGDFVVTWNYLETSGPPSSSDFNILARGFNANGTEIQAEFVVAADNYVNGPSLAMDADGDYVVTWTEFDYNNTSTSDIVSDDFYLPSHTGANAAPWVTGVRVSGDAHLIRDGEQLVSSPSTLVIALSEDVDESLAEGLSNWSLTRDGANVPIANAELLSLGRFQVRLDFASPLGDGDYVLTAREGIEDLSGNLLDGDFDGVEGGDYVLNFSIRSVRDAGGGDSLVNQTTFDDQNRPAVAVDGDGDYVVVWQGYTSYSSSYSDVILARLFNANGTAKGPEFVVNQSFTFSRQNPAVAMDTAGNFVVVWDGDDSGSIYREVFARTFDADGTPNTSELVVSNIPADSGWPDVAMDADGDFVVVWQGNMAVAQDVVGQHMTFDGSTLGGNFMVNTVLTGDQQRPSIAMDAEGAFVVVWSGYTYAYSAFTTGIAMRRYDSDGRPRAATFGGTGESPVTLDPYLPFNGRTEADVAMDAGGDFVVVWTDWALDISYLSSISTGLIHADVKAQRYSAAGIPIDTLFGGSEIDGINESAYKPSVAMDADGDFVVSFTTSDPTAYFIGPSYIYGFNPDIMVRRIAFSGEVQAPAVQANSFQSANQDNSSIAMDAEGNVVVVWASSPGSSNVSQDGDEDGVYSHRYTLNAGPTTSGIPDQVVDEDSDPFVLNLAPHFADDKDPDAELTFAIVGNTNPTLVALGLQGSQLGLALFPDEFGSADITIRCTDTNGLWVEDTFTLTVNDIAEQGPVVKTKKEKSGCAADASTGAAPWGLLAMLMVLFGSMRTLVSRKRK